MNWNVLNAPFGPYHDFRAAPRKAIEGQERPEFEKRNLLVPNVETVY